ncbi:MAG TPA: ribokinase [Acidimicrobiales bacterium]|nr:ribokinase [Acidimicrobiales bacterium]|tara:strand:+ start:4490 stop:5422 length:933 start_codon:yes stop_codon:yes gene_type:complete
MLVGEVDSVGHVLVVGSTMIDLVAYTQRVPEAGETIVGDRFQMGFGGKGANQAVMAALVGARVTMVNAVGDDSYGEMTIQNLGSFGVDTGFVHVVPGASGVAPIWVERDGANRIVIVPGANNGLTAEMAADAVGSFDDLSVVVGQLEVPQAATTAGFGEARSRGVLTVLNPAPATELDPDLLAVTDWLIPNEIEFGFLAGGVQPEDAFLVEYADRTGTRLLVTLGGDGVAMVGVDGSVSRFPADMVEPVDTTGAGDAFVGSFVAGLAVGLDEVSAIRLGMKCAGESVTRPGTQASFPSRERCAEILASGS